MLQIYKVLDGPYELNFEGEYPEYFLEVYGTNDWGILSEFTLYTDNLDRLYTIINHDRSPTLDPYEIKLKDFTVE